MSNPIKTLQVVQLLAHQSSICTSLIDGCRGRLVRNLPLSVIACGMIEWIKLKELDFLMNSLQVIDANKRQSLQMRLARINSGLHR